MRRLPLAVLSLSASMLALTAPALAQTAQNTETTNGPVDAATDPTAEDTQTAPQDTVVVTGSRFADRTISESPAPIDVIGGTQLQKSGATETNRVLSQLVPSFNFPQPSLTDGTDSLRPATLRGLSPDQTLVLVNGKRRHVSALLNLNGSVGRGSSGVDLNQIPPIAIGRVEILRDGASSQYGSDAIAGVINVELSKAQGVSGSVTFGQYRTSMAGEYQATGVAVGPNGQPIVATTLSGVNIFQLNRSDENRKRHDGDTLTLATRLGLPVTDGYLVFSAQFRDRQPTNRSGADPRRQYFGSTAASDPRELTIDRYNHRYGDGTTQDYNLFLNAGKDLGNGAQLYAFGSYGIRDGDGAGFFRRSGDARNRDFSASTAVFVPFYPDGFLPLIDSQIEDVSGAVGVKGDIGGGIKADLSLVYGSNQLDYGVENSFNTSLGSAASPRKFNAGGIAAGQAVANLDLSRKFDVGFAQSFGIAAGFEWREENFRIRAGEPASYINGPFSANGAAGGAQVFPGFRPNNQVDVTRDSYAGYLELDVDFSDAFTVQAAGRYEHYSDFGDTVNGKIAARLEPIRGIAIRGGISTGFRAPSLAQQYFATTSTNSTTVNNVATLIEVGTFPVGDPVSRALGSQPLKPEKALNISGGVVLTPFEGLSITGDYYNIRINDRITLTENLSGAGVVAILNRAGINNVTSARFFVNGVDTRTQGVDVVATYRLPELGIGRVNLTAGYNYNETKITDRAVLPSLPQLALFGRQESFRLTNGQPKSKVNLTADWDLGPVGLTARGNRYGTVLTTSATSGITIAPDGAVTIADFGTQPGDFKLTPKWLIDLEARFHPTKEIELAVGADNVFDIYPNRLPTVAPYAPNSFYIPYSSLSPFGFSGRYLYGRIAFNF